MERVLVIGARAQGGPCAANLSRVVSAEEILLGDFNQYTAERVAEKIGSDKKTFKLDGGKKEEAIAAVLVVSAWKLIWSIVNKELTLK